MRELKDQAVILHAGLFHEADIWLRVLCRENGLHTVFAFGGAKSIRRFCGCLDIFNTLECRIRASKNGEYMILEEASLITAPRNLRHNWRRMGIAANCLRFLEAFGINGESSVECFSLLSDLHSMLENDPVIPEAAPLFFRLRAATALGFAPDFGVCSKCGVATFDSAFFNPGEGALHCGACAENLAPGQKRQSISITGKCADILKGVQTSLPTQWPKDFTPGPERRMCGRVIDGFVQSQLGLEWDKGRFKRI